MLVTLIIRERTGAGLDAPQAIGRRPGRKPKLNDADIAAPRALLRDPSFLGEDIARRLHVAPGTLYRHLPAARASVHEGHLSRDEAARVQQVSYFV